MTRTPPTLPLYCDGVSGDTTPCRISRRGSVKSLRSSYTKCYSHRVHGARCREKGRRGLWCGVTASGERRFVKVVGCKV